jgi:hypothetical protein
MKNSFKLFGVIAIIALTVVSCASSGTAASSHWEEKLNLGGYITDSSGKAISGPIAFTDGDVGSKIQDNGVFNYFRGIPIDLVGFSEISSFFSDWEDAAASNGAQFFKLDSLQTDRSNKAVYVEPLSSGGNRAGSRPMNLKMSFIYVNQDVTITGAASSKSVEATTNESEREYYQRQGTEPPKHITSTEALNISLKAGWNSVCLKTLRPYIGQMPGLDINTDISAYISSPVGIRWVLR